MRSILTISLPEKMNKEINQWSRKFGFNKSELAQNAIRKYLWELKFKTLRMKGAARARKLGFFTDEDIFDRFS